MIRYSRRKQLCEKYVDNLGDVMAAISGTQSLLEFGFCPSCGLTLLKVSPSVLERRGNKIGSEMFAAELLLGRVAPPLPFVR